MRRQCKFAGCAGDGLQKAIEIHEAQNIHDSIPTDRDCAQNGGCPADTWNPAVNEQTRGTQPASYGWLQFTPGAISDALGGLTPAQQAQLSLNAQDVHTLVDRVTEVTKWYGRLANNGNPSTSWVGNGWASNDTTFTTETGLSKINYDRMVSFGEIGKTLKAVHNTYASVCNGIHGTSACYWNHWQHDDPVAKQALLNKASTELGATQTRLNLYIRDPANMGEARAGFQWAALTAGTLGQKLINIMSNKAKYDVLAWVWVKHKIKQATTYLHYSQTGPWTIAQEERIAYIAASYQNSGGPENSTYPPKIIPIFKTTFCADGNLKNSNGYLRMDPLKIGQ